MFGRDRAAVSRVLFLTCHLPYPPLSGGRRREYELIRRLAPRVDLHVLAVSKTMDEDVAYADALRELCAEVRIFEAGSGSIDDSRDPFQVRRHCCDSLAATVGALVRNRGIDVVHVEGFYLMQHVPPAVEAPVLLVEQNVEYQLWWQRAAVAPDQRTKLRLLAEYRQTRTAEVAAWRRSALMAVLTEDDRNEVLAVAPDVDVRVVPDGTDHASAWELSPDPLVAELRSPLLVFVGNFSYEPNVDAARHLCEDILPRIAERGARVYLALVGALPPPELVEVAAARDDVVVTGCVPAIEPYLDRADVVLAPLRVGGGVKVKVLEALGRGKAIVATSVAAQGLGPDARGAMRIEDDAGRFADAVVGLLRDRVERHRLEQAARRLALSLPTWDEAAEALAGCYGELCNEAPQVAVRVSERTPFAG